MTVADGFGIVRQSRIKPGDVGRYDDDDWEDDDEDDDWDDDDDEDNEWEDD
jgi:hypothetical protein